MATVQVTEYSDQNRLKSNWGLKTVGLHLTEVNMTRVCVHMYIYKQTQADFCASGLFKSC